MVAFFRGDVIIVDYPFTDASAFKRRPVLVIASPYGDDIIVCQITSRMNIKRYAIEIFTQDIEGDSLSRDSYIMCHKISTIAQSQVIYRVGRISKEKMQEVARKIEEILL